MGIQRKDTFIQELRRIALMQDGAGLTDAQLLEAYVRGGDAVALDALVGRHGPMVWGVCRRILRNHHDAEDAFQATFLVLLRKAASVAPKEMLANWLYGVAHLTALKAKSMAGKRQAREKQLTAMPEAAETPQNEASDLLPLLDRELSRLPDKYRAPIVLCDLEGKTQKQVAVPKPDQEANPKKQPILLKSKQPSAPQQPSAFDIVKAYKTNAALVDDKFADKGVVLTGIMLRITKESPGNYLLTNLRTAAGLNVEGCYLLTMSSEATPPDGITIGYVFQPTETNRKLLAGVEAGDLVTVEGTCKGHMVLQEYEGQGYRDFIFFVDSKIVRIHK